MLGFRLLDGMCGTNEYWSFLGCLFQIILPGFYLRIMCFLVFFLFNFSSSCRGSSWMGSRSCLLLFIFRLHLINISIQSMSYISNIPMPSLLCIQWFFICLLHFSNFKKTSWWCFQSIRGLYESTFPIRKHMFQFTF